MSRPELEATREIARMASAAGGRAYLVGGCVRDIILGETPGDLDMEVYSIPPEKLEKLLAQRYRLDFVGASFGVFKLHGHSIDVALPRRETRTGPKHGDFEIEHDEGITLKEAAARRDFTVNAIYMDPLTGEIEDPWGGRDDLEKRILRHVSEHFSEDPLRVLRGMQFVARFDLAPAPETVAECRKMTWKDLPQERVFAEWTKLLVKGKKISAGLNFLRDTGWIEAYPELKALIGCKQDPEWHPEGDVWNHTLASLDAFAEERNLSDAEETIIGLAVLCHDFGKPSTTWFDPKKNHIRSIGHDERGVEPTLAFLKRMTNEERILREVPPLVRYHMRPFSMWKGKSSDGAIRRLAAKVVRIDRLARVASADDGGRPPFPREPEPVKWLLERAEALKVADAAPKPILLGRDLLSLGMTPSPQFGKILAKCFKAQLDGKFHTREEALAFLAKNIGRLCK